MTRSSSERKSKRETISPYLSGISVSIKCLILTTNQNIQVLQLNTMISTKIAPSPISGVGVFAIRDLKKGTKLYADNIPRVFDLSYGNFSHLLPEVKQILLEQFPQIVNGSKFVWPTIRLQAYMNHSENYNYIAEDDSDERYFCPPCLVERKELATKIDKNLGTGPKVRVKSDLELYDEAKKVRGGFPNYKSLPH